MSVAPIYYKYRADNIFTENIISDRKVFLATAHQLNDPFECSITDISREWVDEQILAAESAGLSGFILSALQATRDGLPFFGAQTEDIQRALDAIQQASDADAKYAVYRAFMIRYSGHPPSDAGALYGRLDEQLVGIGIFSLSRDPTHPLMWAHYGDQHRGLCLGFRETPDSKLAKPEHCLPVIYSDDLPRMDEGGLRTAISFAVDAKGRPYASSLKMAFDDSTFQRVISTKPKDWSYEQEIRYVEPFSGLCDWPGELAECTFGLRCSDERRQFYIDLLEEHVPNAVALFEIRRISGTKGLERIPFEPEITRPRATSLRHPEPHLREELTVRQFEARMSQLIQQERYGEVIFQAGENLKREPDHPVFLQLKAVAHGLAREHQKAYQLFVRLGELYPDAAEPLYGQACAAEELGLLDQVVPLLRRAAELDSHDASIPLNLGSHLARNPATRPEALKYLRQAERLGHRRAGVMIREVELMIRRDDNK